MRSSPGLAHYSTRSRCCCLYYLRQGALSVSKFATELHTLGPTFGPLVQVTLETDCQSYPMCQPSLHPSTMSPAPSGTTVPRSWQGLALHPEPTHSHWIQENQPTLSSGILPLWSVGWCLGGGSYCHTQHAPDHHEDPKWNCGRRYISRGFISFLHSIIV